MIFHNTKHNAIQGTFAIAHNQLHIYRPSKDENDVVIQMNCSYNVMIIEFLNGQKFVQLAALVAWEPDKTKGDELFK